MFHSKGHKNHRTGWLRAAVLGANDGIVSTSSLILGVAAAGASHQSVVVAAIAGLVAGAMSMAAGEFVSVSSQKDTVDADLALEREHLRDDPDFEQRELAAIYVSRGLDGALAKQVATQLMHHDALAAHARDELGISDHSIARPVQAALTSAAAFSVGAFLPTLTTLIVPIHLVMPIVSTASLVFLAVLGSLAAFAGGSPILRAAARVSFWGAMAMALTAIVGMQFDISV